LAIPVQIFSTFRAACVNLVSSFKQSLVVDFSSEIAVNHQAISLVIVFCFSSL